MKYLSGTIKYGKTSSQNYQVTDYSSIDLVALKQFFIEVPEHMIDVKIIQDNDKWERIALELYDNPNYWDILLYLNNRNPLTGLPLAFETLVELSEDSIKEYQNEVYGVLPQAEEQIMIEQLEAEHVLLNEQNRTIKIIRPTYMSAFLQLAKDAGHF